MSSSLVTSMQIVCRDTSRGARTYETHAFERVPADTTAGQLIAHICSWIDAHALLHADSAFVAGAIGATAARTPFQACGAPSFLAMGEHAHRDALQLAVHSRAAGADAEISIGRLHVTAAAAGAGAGLGMLTDVTGVHLLCTRGPQQFTICAYTFPAQASRLFSQSFFAQGGQSRKLAARPRGAPAPAPSLCRAHRDFRVACRAEHAKELRPFALTNTAYPSITVLARDVTLMTTAASVAGEAVAVHTLFFRS